MGWAHLSETHGVTHGALEPPHIDGRVVLKPLSPLLADDEGALL